MRSLYDLGRTVFGLRSQCSRRIARSAICVASGAFLLWSEAVGLAFEIRPRVYGNADSCRATHSLTDAECLQAYGNAKAEFYEKAPRFSTRADCERHFRHCMIADISNGGRRVTFIPLMAGFRIESGRQRQTFPVVDGGEAGALFRPRAVDRVDSSVSAARTAEAQKLWQVLTSAPAPAAASPQDISGRDGIDEASAPGPVQSYPVSPAMLQDLKERERTYGLGAKP